MRINIIAVGKLKKSYLKKGIDDYMKRLSRYAKINIIEVMDEKAPENLSPSETQEIKDIERHRIESKIPANSYVIALDMKGKSMTSEGFASHLNRLMVKGKSNITFIIGGSIGLAQQLLQQADLVLSFSDFTFPHQLMRLILLEQIYRAFKIIRNEPYHK